MPPDYLVTKRMSGEGSLEVRNMDIPLSTVLKFEFQWLTLHHGKHSVGKVLKTTVRPLQGRSVAKKILVNPKDASEACQSIRQAQSAGSVIGLYSFSSFTQHAAPLT